MCAHKIIHFFLKKKNNACIETVEMLIDAPIYERLKKRAHTEGVSENDILLYSLRRGMNDYWLHVAKYERERNQLVEKLFEQSKRDNELLEALINQNECLRQILEDREKQVKSGSKQ